MPQSLSRIIVHGVFSVKQRLPLLTPEIREVLFPYIGGILRQEGCTPIQVGGYDDHIHLLYGMSRIRTIAQNISEVKTSTTKLLKEQYPACRNFAWQAGYGSWSVGGRDLDAAINYLQDQAEHHKTESFQDEYRRLLAEQGIEFDERYLWDKAPASARQAYGVFMWHVTRAPLVQLRRARSPFAECRSAFQA